MDEPPSEGAASSGSRADRLERLVARCLSRVEAEGRGALDALCDEHPDLAEDLRAQIAFLERAGLAGPSGGLPERLGDFVPLRRLGGGGMGVVWLARQESLGREVALKVVRPEQLWFPETRARFRREAEAIARLKHPNIVPVYTVGETDGVPWFAMEHVEGRALSELLRDLHWKLPADLCGSDLLAALGSSGGETPETFAGSWEAACLRVVRQVARALEHAHGAGVLHRDVKPSNVILGPDGRARLFDFGLALQAREADRLTRTGSQPGSLHYMAPEQVRGEAVDARTDVYALGVTLFELLTLRPPYDGDTTHAVRRRILEARPAAVRALNPDVTWEAETVVAAAMAPEPERRYASAAALADDLERVLARRPIRARRPGPALRARRWLQRHPTRAVALLLATVVALGGGEWFRRQRAVRAQIAAAETEALRRSAEADRVAQVIEDLFLGSDPSEARGREVTAREVLDRAVARLRTDLADQPVLQSRLLQVLGGVYKNLGLFPEARELLTEALEIRRAALDEPDLQVAHALNHLGGLLHASGETREAGRCYEEALAIFRRLHAGDHEDVAQTLDNLGCLTSGTRLHGPAEPLLRDALAMRERVHGALHPRTIQSRVHLGRHLHAVGKVAAAEAELTRALDEFAALGIADHPEVGVALTNLARIYQETDRVDAALQLFRDSLDVRRRVLDPHHPAISDNLCNQAWILRARGENEAAAELFREALELRRASFPACHPYVTKTLNALGRCLRDAGRFDEAEAALSEDLGCGGDGEARALADLVLLYEARGDDALAAETGARLRALGDDARE